MRRIREKTSTLRGNYWFLYCFLYECFISMPKNRKIFESEELWGNEFHTILQASQKFDFKHTSSHAFAELFIGNQAKKQETSYLLHKRYGRNYPNGLVIHYSKDANGNYWLNLDWSAKYPGGPYFQSNSQIIYFTEEGKYEVRKK